MKILLPPNLTQKLRQALQKAGSREIGGILMGEHVAEECFRIVDLTIQRRGGSVVSFVRTVSGFIDALKKFFQKTEYNYTRFNYLGEWHSHPLFKPFPSTQDIASMQDMVQDDRVGANFAVLLVIKLDARNTFDATVTVFSAAHPPLKGELLLEKTS